MKKSKILLFFAIFLVILYIISFFINIYVIILKEYWFSIACFFVGLYSFLYALMFKLDSSVYYCVLTICIAVISFCQYYFNYDIKFYYPFYLLSFALPSFAVFALFRQKIHFKIFAFFIVECILLIVYKFKYLDIVQMLLINIFYLVLIALNITFRIKRNLKEN